MNAEVQILAWMLSIGSLWFAFSIAKEGLKGKDSDFFVDPKFRKKK